MKVLSFIAHFLLFCAKIKKKLYPTNKLSINNPEKFSKE
jgi:hypothetical protein